MNEIFFPKTITIRVPNFLSRLVSAEVIKRNFLKKNGQGNENEFYNKMLPNMLAFRSYKKEFLREYLDKNIKTSITYGMQEKILDFLAESFDYLYFDESEYECDDFINLRFNTKNEELFANLFVRLDSINIKRSAYLRNLIHEYFNQSEYQKERICFNDEYLNLTNAIANETILQIHFESYTVNAFVVAIEYSVKKEHWFVLYFKNDEYDTLFSVPLFKIKRTLLLHKKPETPNPDVSNKINQLIDCGDFDSAENFKI